MIHTPCNVGNIITAQEMQDRLAQNENSSIRVYSGISCIDEIFKFFRLGEVYVVSGPTGHGKTSFCRHLISSFTDLSYKCLYLGQEGVSTSFFENFHSEVPKFFMSEDFIEADVDWCEQTILKAVRDKDCRIIFIDHLHYMISFRQLMNGNASFLLGEFMRKLVKIVAKYSVLTFLVAHTVKDVIVKVPNLSDVRDASFITQEVNGVLIVYRCSTVNKVTGEITYINNKSKIAVVKNRRVGTLKTFPMKYYNGNFTEDIDER